MLPSGPSHTKRIGEIFKLHNKKLYSPSPRARRVLSTVHHIFYTMSFFPIVVMSFISFFFFKTENSTANKYTNIRISVLSTWSTVSFQNRYFSLQRAFIRELWVLLKLGSATYRVLPTQPNKKNHNWPGSLPALCSWVNTVA